MQKIKVVHIITKLELGGAQVNTIYTYEHLDENKFDVYLLSGPGGILTEKIQKKDKFVIIADLAREINPIKDISAFFHIKKILKKIKPHIVHTHSSKAGIIGRFAAFLLRKKGIPKTVHTVHGFPFSPFQSFLKRKIFEWSERIAAYITGHFVFVANDDINIAREKKIVKKNNFSLIRSGFPLDKFTKQGLGASVDSQNGRDIFLNKQLQGINKRGKNTKSIRAKYDIRETDFVCGIIAPFKPQKGLSHLIEIAALVTAKRKDVVFFIAGDGDKRPDIEAELKSRNIFNNFRLPGFIFAIEDVIDIFDIGVSTALWEGLPQSLIQLRLKKKAVVVSDIPGNREVVRNDKNGYLVDVSDHVTFAERILFLIENDKERDRLANFKEDFSHWDADFMVKVQEKLYRSLTGIIN
jgi:glycosyltransferase involved in cell wall biosynthesis